ncbi:MAG: alpha/beta hydrolase [Proteobacteria bacterium]|nr:alpha/beta hydrolase [Pseudomonadota bacterium]
MKTLVTVAFLLAASLSANAQQALSLPRADGAQTPVMVYDPAVTSESAEKHHGCAPLALLSPGAGGNEKGLSYLAKALAADGWLAIVLGHRESGIAALRNDVRNSHGIRAGVGELVADPNAYHGRFMDIDAALAWSSKQCIAPFKALLGHSMGARTVLLEAGANNKLGLHETHPFDAYVALSPPPADDVFPPDAGRSVSAPILLLTGTRDDTLAQQSYDQRVRVFDTLASRCAWIGIVDGATHMNFAGAGFGARELAERASTTLSTAFLDGLRHGQCPRPPTLAGVSVRSK